MAKRSRAKKQREQEREDQPLSIEEFPDVLAVLPAKDIVAFPGVMMSLYVSRKSSIDAVEKVMEGDRLILVLAQVNQESDNPGARELYRVGVIANVIRTLQLNDGRCKVLLQGLARAEVSSLDESKGYLRARVKPIIPAEEGEPTAEAELLVNRIRANLQVLVENEHVPEEMLLVAEDAPSVGSLADVLLAHYRLDPAQAQRGLEERNPVKRLRMVDAIVSEDLNRFLLSERIRDKARDEMNKGQKEYFLREQIKQIQRELGEAEDAPDEMKALRDSLERAKLPKQAAEEAFRQLKRLERMHPESSEFSLIRTYLDWFVDLPWSERTADRIDLRRAKKILDAEHDGLQRAKDRILEYLSVRKLNAESRGPILCFVGPPGVGKTSLGRSIANALGRKFHRMSLGGMRDEAEIRGHRRTYVGALPGRILQGIKQSASKNPVFVLDELDKIGADFRGDPASALLEVLDPQQNREFRDHYLNVDFDLSEVLFIATANTIDTIPEALLDRLEIIQIPGYTTQEKLKIAKRFLLPRQLKDNGLVKQVPAFTDEGLLLVIERYTREAGVRNLEREIGALCRKLARERAEARKLSRRIDADTVAKLLGPTKYDPDIDEAVDAIGLTRGLAWTAHGGEMMPIEASTAKGGGNLHLTGQLGSVMQESAQAAVFYARATAQQLGLDPDFARKLDIHVHVPQGAIPKDGPSAGITIATALVSTLSGRKAWKDIAMTGEMTLRGNVLAVGGVKEKALAALRHGIKKVIIPFENIKDLEEIPREQRQQIKFIPVRHISEVLEIALAPRVNARPPLRSAKETKRRAPRITS